MVPDSTQPTLLRLPLAFAVVVLMGLVSVLPTYAQSFPARNFGQEDGLSNQSIVGISQQADGHLWIATQNGLFRYDGSQFTRFGRADGLNDPLLLNLFIDRTSTVWASTQSGLFYLSPSDPEARFRELKVNGISRSVPINSHFAEDANQHLLISDQFGLLLLVPEDASAVVRTASIYRDQLPGFPPHEQVGAIAVDRSNTLWYACQHAICSFHPDRSHRNERTESSGSLHGVPEDTYYSFFVDHTGAIWARSFDHLVTWSPSDKTVRDLTRTLPADALKPHKLRITEDPHGHILITTTNGFAFWDGTRWNETTTATQGPITGATDLFFDSEGSLWIGTAGNGVLQSLGYGLWQNFSTTNGLPSPIVFALQNDRRGRLWIGHKLGISVIESGLSDQSPRIHSILKGDPKAVWIEAMAPAADGGIWAASSDGDLWHFNPNEQADIHTLISGGVESLKLAPDGTLWSAGSGGLFAIRCRPQNPCRPTAFPDAALRRPFFRDILFDQTGDMWLLSDTGLWKISTKTGLQTATSIAVPGVSKSFLLGSFASDGTLWLTGRFPGIIHLKVSGNAAQRIPYAAANQLTNDAIQFLQTDSDGKLWIGTDHGVKIIENDSITQITNQDGLIWNDTDWKAFLEASDGTFWIGTSGGVSHFLNSKFVPNQNPFRISWESATYNGKPIHPGDSIKWNAGIFATRFSPLTFRDSRTILFHYTMDGLDRRGVDTPYPSLSFQNLPPGSYNLHITAEDTVHHVVSLPASFPFTLTPPWWRTQWFNALLVLAGGLLIAMVWRWSHLALLAQRTRLQRLVEERTAELYKMASTDPLTGLPNRGSIMTRLSAESVAAQKASAPLCVAIVDLDHFKSINDTYGHRAGDQVLCEAARRLASGIRSTDFLGRYGGEEFLIVFHNAKQEVSLERCETIRQTLCAKPILIGDAQLTVTASIGVAWTRIESHQSKIEESLIGLADKALYQAKSSGRNRVVLADAEAEFVY